MNNTSKKFLDGQEFISSGISYNVLCVVAIVIICAGLISTLMGTEPSIVKNFSLMNFMDKLEYIGDTFTIDIKWIDEIHIDSFDEEWAILDGVRIFINSIVDGVKFVTLISVGLVQVLSFVVGCVYVLIL